MACTHVANELNRAVRRSLIAAGHIDKREAPGIGARMPWQVRAPIGR
jgi:hypothetical protein